MGTRPFLHGFRRWLERTTYDLLWRLAPQDGSVVLQPITQKYGVLVLAGPKSRDVLKKLTRTSLENKEFPWLTGKQISVGVATAHALRVNFVGELGWELHHPIEMQPYIFDMLMEAVPSSALSRSAFALWFPWRVEKSYRNMGRELSIEYNAYESRSRPFHQAREELCRSRCPRRL